MSDQAIMKGDVMNGTEVVPTSALESITRGEIDMQITTAKRYPRSVATFLDRARQIVSIDVETAESCLYRRPVGKENGREKYAEGMSIRMAEIVGACYGNLRVGSLLVEQTDRYVKARGFAHDLETNYAAACEVIESTVDKYGNPYKERQRVVVAKAALAKARRDATFMVVPKAMCKPLETTAKKVAIGDETTLLARRANVLAWIDSLPPGSGRKFDRNRVYEALGISGEADLGLEQLAELTGIKTAIKDGDVTVDEAFPPVAEAKKPLISKKGEPAKSEPADTPNHAAQQSTAPTASDPAPPTDLKPSQVRTGPNGEALFDDEGHQQPPSTE